MILKMFELIGFFKQRDSKRIMIRGNFRNIAEEGR